jgi:tetratricopeptide (TPR) repeat protein
VKLTTLLFILFLSLSIYAQEKKTMETAQQLNVQGVQVLNTDPEKALSLFKKAHSIDSSVADYPNNAGVALLNLKKFKEASVFFAKATEIDTSYTRGFYNLGVCYQAMGENQQAITAYRKARKLAPSSPEIYYNLGIVYERENNKKEAIKSYEGFLKHAPNEMKQPIADAKEKIKRLKK